MYANFYFFFDNWEQIQSGNIFISLIFCAHSHSNSQSTFVHLTRVFCVKYIYFHHYILQFFNLNILYPQKKEQSKNINVNTWSDAKGRNPSLHIVWNKKKILIVQRYIWRRYFPFSSLKLKTQSARISLHCVYLRHVIGQFFFFFNTIWLGGMVIVFSSLAKREKCRNSSNT